VIDREVVAPADRGQHWSNNVLRDVVDTLAVGADKVVVMLRVAGDVCRHMAVALEAARHPVLDLLLQRAVHRRPADRRVSFPDPLVELLS